MKIKFLTATAVGLVLVSPAMAQTAPAAAAADEGEIIVTAQRQSESLQRVPIAVSAFSSEMLERQQIKNSSDLQLTLPNVTFTKTNFTGASFTIRGVGDLCVGTSCDAATAIHTNGSPLIETRLFESEFFDLERVEVLRGPQGTLFGRNATSGVVNFITAKPDLSGFHAAGEGEYGNFKAYKLKGMINVPIGDTIGIRVAGFYQKRDGYTENLYDGSRIDGRDMYGARASLRWQPTASTTFDLMGYYFREKDNRSRIQKQMCHRDPTGVLGCLPDRLEFGQLNYNATFQGTLSSSELLRINTAAGGAAFSGLFASLGLGSLYGPDAYSGFVNPANVRQVRQDFNPQYFAEEQQVQAHLQQDLGRMKLGVTGMYQRSVVDSRADYNQAVVGSSGFATGLANLRTQATAGAPFAAYFAPIVAALSPTAGTFCTSDTESTGTGAYGGFKNCGPTPLDYDRSNRVTRTWSGEAILSSDFAGAFNFLLGGIYVDSQTRDNNYYVNAFSADYIAGVLGAATGIGGGLPPGYQATPYFRNDTPFFGLKSYGLFGEGYLQISDGLKLTLGLRYNHDQKEVRARSTLASFYTPFTATDAFVTPYGAQFDADPATACTAASRVGTIGSVVGCDSFQLRKVSFSAWTGRAVLDWKISPDNLLYASYSRGYKSGGINPPLQPVFAVPDSFTPEFIDSFEIGSKNSFAGGALKLNLTAFYYKYKSLQLSRIVARTAVNDNVDANIYGLEAEAVLRPIRQLQVNIGFSYLRTEVASDKFLSNPRDPSGGRSDVVIIKDITNAANCVVAPTTAGNVAGANQLVGAVNGSIGLRAPGSFGSDSGVTATGAYGICSALAGAIANPSAPLRALFVTPTGALPFSVLSPGVDVNLRGNQLPQAPNYKWNIGVQYEAELGGGMTLIPRADLVYTGDSYGNIFNGPVNRIPGYSQINAQIQLNGPDDRWFARAFVQNLTDNSAITGLYVTDPSSGLYTNIFTLEPRRYGLAVGFKL